MKQLISLILIFFSLNCFSQAINPDLFRTWYLFDYYSTDDNIHHPIVNISPAISPSLTISAAMTFTGQGACNSFSGTTSATFPGTIFFSNFARTQIICSSSSHTTFEDSFFSFMQTGGQYYVAGTGDDMTLVLTNPIFYQFVFKNYQLGTPTIDLKQTIIYPNPADSKIVVDVSNRVIDKIEFFNAIGQNIKTIKNDFEGIDISELNSGMYLLKIFTKGEVVYKKLMKK